MEIIFVILILVFSAVIHELAHGAVAYQLGDPTAKYAGRITLNPLKHLDPIGSVLVPLLLVAMTRVLGGGFIFAWAKPVPINPRNFRDQKYGSAKVALAGPASNLAIAVFFGLILRFFPQLAGIAGLYLIFGYIVYVNILLAIFNLIPVPPLDGHHILFSFLPYSMQRARLFSSQYSLFILLFILFFLFPWIVFIIKILFLLIVGGPISIFLGS